MAIKTRVDDMVSSDFLDRLTRLALQLGPLALIALGLVYILAVRVDQSVASVRDEIKSHTADTSYLIKSQSNSVLILRQICISLSIQAGTNTKDCVQE